MTLLKKYITLMIVLLLSYSISWSQNDNSSTGELETQDSVLININAIKIANAKMIELKYEKEINKHYLDVICADSTIIVSLQNNARNRQLEYESKHKEIVKEKQTAILHGSITSGVLLLLLIIVL